MRTKEEVLKSCGALNDANIERVICGYGDENTPTIVPCPYCGNLEENKIVYLGVELVMN